MFAWDHRYDDKDFLSANNTYCCHLRQHSVRVFEIVVYLKYQFLMNLQLRDSQKHYFAEQILIATKKHCCYFHLRRIHTGIDMWPDTDFLAVRLLEVDYETWKVWLWAETQQSVIWLLVYLVDKQVDWSSG